MNNDNQSVAIPTELHRRLADFAQRHDLGELDALICDILADWLEEQEDSRHGGEKRAVKTSPDLKRP